MSRQETELILSLLKPDDTMLEYGCGGSTMFFPKFVKKYYSIESDPKWATAVEQLMPGNVTMHLTPVSVNKKIMANRSMSALKWNDLYKSDMHKLYKNYIQKITEIEEDINAVLIDGRSRASCARFIYDHISQDTVVFIHDWCRPRYKTVLEKYKLIKEINTGQMIAALKKK